MSKIYGQNVLVTGAAMGIGRLLVHLLAQRGAHVVAWDIDDRGLASLVTELPGQVTTYHCDMSEREAIYATAREVLAAHERVDILINNAGIVQGKSLLQADDAEIERTFSVNTLAHFWTVRAFLPGMLARRRGHIVTVASAGGIVGTARLIDYSASKYAAVGFDDTLRLEMKRQGRPIKTTVVCPWFIDTGMFHGVKTRFPFLLPILQPDDVAQKIVRAIEKNRPRVLLPPTVYTAYIGRLLPVSLFDFIVDFVGVTRSMDEFTGRKESE